MSDHEHTVMVPARHRGRRRKGAATVEFALVAPVLFLTVLGVFEIQRAFMVIHGLNEAARQGCRAAVTPWTSAQTVQTAVDNILTAYAIHGYSTTVQVDGTTVSPYTAASATSGQNVGVVVTVPVSSISIVPHGFMSGSLSGQCTLQKE
jgi:Flp pilus assembly protein TadG